MDKVKILLKITCAVLTITLCNAVKAQTVPVGMVGIEDYYRRLQLMGKVDSNLSFSVRPINPEYAFRNKDPFFPDGREESGSSSKLGPKTFANGKGIITLLPLTIQQQFNSHHPYGWNDGVMIPAKGYQTMVSGGFFMKYGALSIQFRPEYVYASNNFFTAPNNPNPQMIDDPVRFGSGPYNKIFWGQSSIKLTFEPIAIGLSNENVWWGPGIANAIILSNNAPGFKHLTLNTVRPINSLIGKFEGQILAGRLESSGYQNVAVINPNEAPFRTEWRYFTGFNINYSPKWVPELSLGLTRTFNAYHSDVTTLKEYIPFFFSYQKKDSGGDPFERDQYTSLYARWLFNKENAELYFEYGVNDNSYNYRDFLMTPEHARAYTFGARKMFTISNKANQHILFETEITQLSQNPDRIIRGLQTWYVHGGVRQGHTNDGQVLGAGIGQGSNIQSLSVSWVSDLKRIGFRFDRRDVNGTYSSALKLINGGNRNWVDYSVGVYGEWNYKNLIFNAKLLGIKSLNYLWLLNNYNPNEYYVPNNTVYNLHSQLGVNYRF